MLFRTQRRREQACSEVLDSLGSHEGTLLTLKEQGGELTLSRATFERVGYLWRIVPLYKVTNRSGGKMNIIESVMDVVEVVTKSLRSYISAYSNDTWAIVIQGMRQSLNERINAARGNAETKVAAAYAVIHQKFLLPIITKNQNEFRQQLAEAINTTARESFTGIIQRNIGMFLMKLHEEGNKHTGAEYASSGAHALPNGCKFVFHKKDASVYVIEQLPQIRTIEDLGTRYRISVPYVIFVLTLRNNRFMWLQVLFRNSPLCSEADELLCPAFPNIYNDRGRRFKICFPAPRSDGQTPSKIADEAAQNYWGSKFNKDLRGYYEAAMSQNVGLTSFGDWHRRSATDPQFGLKVAWQPAQINVVGLVADNLDTALDIKAQGEERRSSAETLQLFAKNLGERFGREVAEKLHFMVSHSRVDVNSLAPAQTELVKTLNTAVAELKQEIGKVLSEPLSDEELASICKSAEQQLRENVDNSLDRFSTITEKLRRM